LPWRVSLGASREEADRYRALAGAVAYPRRDAAAEHAAIAAAALNRDAARAAELLAGHLATTGELVQRAVVERRQRPAGAARLSRRQASQRPQDPENSR
jgi:DNA-binding GntR family transcriptional regulator